MTTRICVSAAFVLLLAPVAQAQDEVDTDRDGIPDHREDLDGDGVVDFQETDPNDPDTDGDGTRDGAELARGTDPARNGFLEIPEPMVFDMVRGLGAEQGELEVNVLAIAPIDDPFVLVWAPEIEYALFDGQAIEFELGFDNVTLHAVKLAFQGTAFVNERGSFATGYQLIVEGDPTDETLETVLLHLIAWRIAGPLSFVSLIGVSAVAELADSPRSHAAFIGNANLFYALIERVNVGIELNVEVGEAGLDLLRVTPQLHWQIDNTFRLQVGASYVRFDEDGVDEDGAEVTARVIAEI